MTTLTYRNGRDWGTCNGACGAVETFKACADIAIIGRTLEHSKTISDCDFEERLENQKNNV